MGRVKEIRRWLSVAHSGADGMDLLQNFSTFHLQSLLSQNWCRVTPKHQLILVSPHFPTFVSLIQGHHKALNHLSFSLLLYFHEPGIISGLFFISHPWAVWRKTRTQSNMCSSYPRQFSRSPLISTGYRIFSMPSKFLWSYLQSAAYTLNVDISPSNMPPS